MTDPPQENSTKKVVKTQMVIKTGTLTKLEDRAKRFQAIISPKDSPSGAGSDSSKGGGDSSKKRPALDPAEAEKLAKRAARFADVQATPQAKSQDASSDSKGSKDDILEKRARRFKSSPVVKLTGKEPRSLDEQTTSEKPPPKPEIDPDLLQRRVARFGHVQ